MQRRLLLTLLLALVVSSATIAVVAWSRADERARQRRDAGLFVDPEALAIDAGGQVLVADEDALSLVVLSPDLARVVARHQRMPGRPELFVTRGGGVAPIGSGHLVLVDAESQLLEVRLRGPELEVVRRFGGGLDGTEGIARGPDGRLYVAEEDRSRVVIFSPEGQRLGHWELPERPEHVTIGEGVAYVCYAHDDWIGRHDLDTGELLGHLAPDAGWSVPDALAIGPDGDLYVSDQGNHRIVVVRPPTPDAPEGEVVRVLGGPGSAPGRFDDPEDIVFDAAGRLIVADGGNGRLQVLDLQGRVIAVID